MRINDIRENAAGRITTQNTTVDVKPGETRRQSAKFGNTLDKNNKPPLLHKTAAKRSTSHVLSNLGLVESFDNKLSLSWHGNEIAKAILPNNKSLRISFDNIGNSVYEIEFDVNLDTSSTGEGFQMTIFATVIDAIKTFNKNMNPNGFIFTAEKFARKRQDTRINLYKSLVKRFSKEIKMDFEFVNQGYKTLFVLTRPDLDKSKLSETSYPIADYDEWYGDRQYKEQGAKLVKMTPDQYIARVRPLRLDDESEDNIEDLINHIKSGRTLDPLKIYPDGKEDGRHRAYAAKRLGIKYVPVIVWPQINEADEIKKPHPSNTLGIKRADMPQVHRDHYPELIDYLAAHGNRFSNGQIEAVKLKAVQSEFSDKGVRKMMSTGGRPSDSTDPKPLIVSSDNYIVDGHHRWLAAYNLGQKVPIMRSSLPIKKLFQLVKDFKHTTYKDIHENNDLTEIRLTKNLNNDDAMLSRMNARLQQIRDGKFRQVNTANGVTSWISNNITDGTGYAVITDDDLTIIYSSLLIKGESNGALIVGMSWTHPKHRRNGHNSSLYQTILDSGHNIRSDSEQTRGSQGVWKSLSKKYKTLLYRENQLITQLRDDQDFAKAYRRSSQSDGYYLVLQSPNGKVMENMSITGTTLSKQDRKKKLEPGTDAWFAHWFSRPYLTRKEIDGLKNEATQYVKEKHHAKKARRRKANRNKRSNECSSTR